MCNKTGSLKIKRITSAECIARGIKLYGKRKKLTYINDYLILTL
jgi:hypothetical protein